MSFGFSGPSGSGKTTLAREIATRTGLPFLEFKTTELVAELDMSPVAELSIEDRFKVQSHLLKRFWEITQAHARPFVSDRTPLDFLTYMLCEVTMRNTSPEFGEQIWEFVKEALSVTDRSFMTVISVRSLPVYAVDPKRPPPNPAYHRHYEMLLEGAGSRLEHISYYKLITSKHEDRVRASLSTIHDEIARNVAERQKRLVC